MPDDARRSIPSLDRLLQASEARSLLESYPRHLVVDALRATLAEARAGTNGGLALLSDEHLVAQANDRLGSQMRPSLRPVINATGVILHTNLGRAPLSRAARQAMEAVAAGYSNLEYDLEAGERGSRHEHLTPLLQRLTGAEASLIVNNNASAVLLALAALAEMREVIISRSQLVEIGGGFRIPDVLRQSGTHLVEVGTTNRTYIGDYASAITDETRLLLRVHASNFQITGFVHETSLLEMVELAGTRGLRVVDDLGSGSLLATERYGLAHEPMVQECIGDGADLVCFSGDKLLGGPQAGIIVGKAAAVATLRSHPLTRAFRPDKTTLATLHATLTHYERQEADREIPVWRMIAETVGALEVRAAAILRAAPFDWLTVLPTAATVGGGSLPGETLPSYGLAIAPPPQTVQEIAARFRAGDPPIVARIADDRVVLDLRTVAPEEDASVIAALRGLGAQPGGIGRVP
ncbi:MAG: L-seryl-tRNA(Sec) selenium transferase [Chloroflexi bacterium]|nr:L-seryl-tRNA(Sec) selenium transferase [Chloroflexota bacterium]